MYLKVIKSVNEALRIDNPLRIEKLNPNHSLNNVDFGREELSRFLIRKALVSQQAGVSRTYLAVSGESVVGYYTLNLGEVFLDEAPAQLKKGFASHPVPIMVLARLAVAVGWQGCGLGAGLLKDAMRRTLQAADIAGIRAFTVHSANESVRSFYENFGFVPSPTDPLHMFLSISDIRSISGE